MRNSIDSLQQVLGSGAGLAVAAAVVIYTVVVFAAFTEGLIAWFDAPVWACVLAVPLIFFLYPWSALPVLVVAFKGAMDGWDFTWWQAGLLCFPGLAPVVIVLAGMSIVSLAQFFTQIGRRG
jgi:hypothetical protein